MGVISEKLTLKIQTERLELTKILQSKILDFPLNVLFLYLSHSSFQDQSAQDVFPDGLGQKPAQDPLESI